MNITRLLHKVSDAIPESFKHNSSPTVLFTRSPSIGSKIFNYKKVVEEVTKDWDANDHTCACSSSPLCDQHHGHIVTGDLRRITNSKLRHLMSKGPTYREANAVDWTKTYRFIRDGIKQCQEAWCTKENVDTRVLNEWKCRLLYEVRAQIKILKKANSTSRGRNTFRETSSFYRHSRKTLDDVTVKTYLNEFHQKYVITPTDKAGNNFSIVCKKFYIACLLGSFAFRRVT